MNDFQPFKVDGWTVFTTLLSSPAGWPVWAILALGFVLVVVGCLADARLIIVGLMICIALAPGVAAYIYFGHTLSPQIVSNMLPHTLERTDGGFLLRVWRPEESEEEQADEEKGDCQWVESSVITLSDSKIVRKKTTVAYELFYFKDSPLKILYVPRT